MHLHHSMCFSNTLICLLVVTCHGSVVNKYQDELRHPDIKYESDQHGDPLLSEAFKIHLIHNSSASEKDSHKNHPFKDLTSSPKENSTVEKENLHKRKSRSSENEYAYPLMKDNSNFDQVPSLSASVVKKRSKAHTNGHSHSHNRHNDSDHDHSNGEKNHHHDYDSKDSEHDEYYDIFEDKLDESSRLPAIKGKSEKTTQPKYIDPCVNKHSHDNTKLLESKNSKSEELASNYYQHPPSSEEIPGKVWLYSSLAVVIISLCGLFSVAVIPIMQKWFYHTLLQFLVGLAVGSLSGDGLLHLMPHAILDGESKYGHSGKENHDHDHDDMVSLKTMEVKAVWRGLAALCGIFLFFVAERLLGAVTAYRKQKNDPKLSRVPKNMLPISRDGANNGSVGEKLAQPKKNSYDHIKEKDEKETIQMLPTEASPSKKGSNQSVHEIGFHGRSSFKLDQEETVAFRPDSESSVMVSDHHGHTHGHSHDVPNSVTAVAWMVILGDGLHNFCDGLAIGAAFASSDADGISTTVAVFCHELPHELGDFAMLLKTGMKVKQALFYNGLSSILCFVGMVIGVALGNVQSATNWVFAGTAGMFLYIALVDMLPELASPSNTPISKTITILMVQTLGILLGVSIMLVIALYEHELHSIVS